MNFSEELPLRPPPAHVAIIMDGNGRWAKARGLPRLLGHRQGLEALRGTIAAASEISLSYLTVYAFSAENWGRPALEVEGLMDLLRRFLQAEIAELQRNGVRLRIIGERSRLPADIMSLIVEAEALTANNDGLTLVLALSYGSRQEIVSAVRRLADAVASGRLNQCDIDEGRITSELYTAAMPDPDLVIRTGGEQRMSNFLLWQLAHAELLFLDKLWPDFTKEDLINAMRRFQAGQDSEIASLESA